MIYLKPSALLLAAASLVSLTGCGLSPAPSANHTDVVVAGFGGTLHGGPNPAVGARVVIYSTTSTGYGVGVALQEATQVGGSAHQDTDANGYFNFPGGFTCPAGQQAYIVAYGGNTGGNVNNPNSIMMTALGSCDTLYTGTTYTGSSVYVNEATTVAAVYSLANFITVSLDSSSLPFVGIGAPASNNGTQGCVPNAYYPTCTATGNNAIAAGLRHAFANATSLVSTNTGALNATTTSGAVLPTYLFNTIANIVQTCVNSGGGGGTATAGTTIISASGTSHDGTSCGRFFAYTSYTLSGASNGTLVTSGNTVDALKNLVKRPTGTASTFDSSCTSNSGTGTTTAATCLFNLPSPINGFFQPMLTAAPQDYIVTLQYPKGSLSNSTSNVFTTTAGCAATTTTNGLLYPQWVTTDINDNISILNGDQSTPKCGDIITIGYDGSVTGGSAVDTTFTNLRSITNDAWGHVILPNPIADGVRFYQYNGGGITNGSDASMPIVTTVLSGGTNASGATTNAAYKGFYAMADSSSRIYIGSQNALNTWGYLAPTTLSHTAPAYTANPLTSTTTSSFQGISIDINNNAFATKSTYPVVTTYAGTSFVNDSTQLSGFSFSGSNGFLAADTTGNLWEVGINGTTVGTSQTVVTKYLYTYTPGAGGPSTAGGTVAFGTFSTSTSPTYTYATNTDTRTNDGLTLSPRGGIIDGANVLWFGDLQGASVASPASIVYASIRGYDTVNNYGTPQLIGCRTNAPASYSVTGYTIGASSTAFTISNTSTIAVNATLTFSGFPTSTFLNGATGTVTASGSGTFTVSTNFGQAAGSAVTEAGSATSRTGTACGSNSGDANYPSSAAYNFYGTRAGAVDTMGNLWFANGTAGTVVEVLGLAAPTLPNYIHNGVSQKP